MSRAARRDVRRAAALANEVNMHSFTIHRDGSITWTPWRQSSPAIKNPGKTAATDAPSKRTLRARARAAQHAALTQQALDFRARCVLSFWRRAATPSKPPQLQPSQLRKPLPPPPLPPSIKSSAGTHDARIFHP